MMKVVEAFSQKASVMHKNNADLWIVLLVSFELLIF